MLPPDSNSLYRRTVTGILPFITVVRWTGCLLPPHICPVCVFTAQLGMNCCLLLTRRAAPDNRRGPLSLDSGKRLLQIRYNIFRILDSHREADKIDLQKSDNMLRMLEDKENWHGEELERRLRAFCERKWNCSFSEEMSRSVKAMLDAWACTGGQQ